MKGRGGKPPLFFIFTMEQFLAHAVNIVIGILIATLWQKFRKSQEEQDAIKLGLQSLLRGEITKAYYRYKEQGWIPLYALESIEGNYKNYEILGANGVIDGLWKELMALPHTKPDGDKK